jgi:hypothetical protein
MSTIDLGTGEEVIDLGTGEEVIDLVQLVQLGIEDFLPNSNRISETKDIEARLKAIIYIDNANSLYEINIWYLRLFCLFNIILMIITIIYSCKTTVTKKYVYIIFLCLDILFILVNILFSFFLIKKNFIYNFKIENLYEDQAAKIVIYFGLNIIFTSIMFYFIIDSLYGSWVDKGTNRRTLRWIISVFSILEFFLMMIIETEMEYPDKVPDNVLEYFTKN